jgi:hypothetical protein
MSYWDGSRWASDAPVATNSSRPGRRLLGAAAEAGLISLLLVGLIAGTTFAAKGGNGGGGKGKPGGSGTSTVTLVLVHDANANGVANWGDTVTFSIATTATRYPHLEVTCYQNGTLVYGASAGFYAEYPWPGAQMMPLKSPAWTSGAAECKAVLNTSLATLNFGVQA